MKTFYPYKTIIYRQSKALWNHLWWSCCQI